MKNIKLRKGVGENIIMAKERSDRTYNYGKGKVRQNI